MSVATPRELGYRMPAEWYEHEATWLSWPKNPLTFPEDTIDQVEEIYCKMISALSKGEKVKLLVDDEGAMERVAAKLQGHDVLSRNVIFYKIKSADVWIRDYGPTFLINEETKKKAAVRWIFNAWGGKYDDLIYDEVTGNEVVSASGVKTFRPGIVLEGGSIDVNGCGSLLTTEQCLLNKNRNPQLDREQIQQFLKDYVDAENIIWLKSGIEGDDTDGHVDDFARFVSPSRVVCAHSEEGENSVVLRKNLEILKRARDENGDEFEVIALPMPRPLKVPEEDRFLPSSYANFYVGNKVVLLPVFNDPLDEKAREIIQDSFPSKEVVGIVASDLVYGYGGIHCVTQQEPLI